MKLRQSLNIGLPPIICPDGGVGQLKINTLQTFVIILSPQSLNANPVSFGSVKLHTVIIEVFEANNI
jgi:hypothetical protein